MSGKKSTSDIISAAQGGDKASWDLVYSRFYTAMYAIAVQQCSNLAMAQDAVQDTFIIAYLRLGELRDPAAFPGWIKKILLHTCFKACRRESNDQPFDADWAEHVGQIDREIEDRYDWLATRGALYSGLAILPEALRATLLLRYFFSFQTYQEIASILGIPIGTVRSRLNQARLKLKEQWQPDNEDTSAIKETEFWNDFYLQTLASIHQEDRYTDRFIGHFSKNAKLFKAGSTIPGDCSLFRKMIQDDRRAGSWLCPAKVTTSGNISIIESRHFNAPGNSQHCPDMSLMIIERENDKANKLQLHVF